MAPVRWILHLDMDAFYAAVEQRDDPALRGKPVLVGHAGPRGVVATASYEARRYGCHSAQPMVVARRLCPNAIIVPVHGDRYQEVSEQVFAILDGFSPVVEPVSIDEAFLDLGGTERLLGTPETVARQLKDRIRAELHLTASAGVATNKFLAKLASDMNKPDGLTIIRPEDVARLLPPMPVTRLWGIGQVTAARLAKFGIATVGDLLGQPLEQLTRHLGAEAEWYVKMARGLDDRPVTADREAKSIGHEQTFETDVPDPEKIHRVMLEQVEQVGRRLRRQGLKARAVSVKIRYGNFQTITRAKTFGEPTDATAELWQAARELFDKWPFQSVRLIGVTAERLSRGGDMLLPFADSAREQQEKLDRVTDRINDRYGEGTIKRGGGEEQ
jgi:DNA polymerase-4